jgi:hypothetical protein
LSDFFSATVDQPTVTFYRVYPGAIAPMRADKAALGVIPTMGYRHCEPLRAASAFGWYIFPPERILLRFNGADVLYFDGDDWKSLRQINLPGFKDYWNEFAPPHLKDLMPPFITKLPVSGGIQIWSGLLCSTRENWSLHVRPLANIESSHMFSCYEGIVESDRHRPFPLFINMQLKATGIDIEMAKTFPLFQVQAVHRDCYGEVGHRFEEHAGLEPDENGLTPLGDAEWEGYRRTIRVEFPDQLPEPGKYTVATRKRGKNEL